MGEVRSERSADRNKVDKGTFEELSDDAPFESVVSITVPVLASKLGNIIVLQM
jgi:hypothetical protein